MFDPKLPVNNNDFNEFTIRYSSIYGQVGMTNIKKKSKGLTENHIVLIQHV